MANLKNGENILDFCIKEYGSILAIFDLMRANNEAITGEWGSFEIPNGIKTNIKVLSLLTNEPRTEAKRNGENF